MPNSERNVYTHVMFGDGRFGTFQLMAGGNLEVKSTDTFRLDGDTGDLLIEHNDEYESKTFVPHHNIGYIRTRLPGHKPVASPARPMIDREKLKEITE